MARLYANKGFSADSGIIIIQDIGESLIESIYITNTLSASVTISVAITDNNYYNEEPLDDGDEGIHFFILVGGLVIPANTTVQVIDRPISGGDNYSLSISCDTDDAIHTLVTTI
ncbi:hypothetical protein H8D85_02250 [bacterium]|nr:hypothetical protein [bacterium]